MQGFPEDRAIYSHDSIETNTEAPGGTVACQGKTEKKKGSDSCMRPTAVFGQPPVFGSRQETVGLFPSPPPVASSQYAGLHHRAPVNPVQPLNSKELYFFSLPTLFSGPKTVVPNEYGIVLNRLQKSFITVGGTGSCEPILQTRNGSPQQTPTGLSWIC